MFKFLVLGIIFIASNVKVAYQGSPTYKPTVTSPPKSSIKLPSVIPLDKILPKKDIGDEDLIEKVESGLELVKIKKPTKKPKNPNSYNKQNEKGLKGVVDGSLNIALGQPRELLPI